MKKNMKTKLLAILCVLVFAMQMMACGGGSEPAAGGQSGSGSESASGPYFDRGESVESIVTRAATAGTVGNWGLGNEYEIQALLTKYNQPTAFLSQAFDMNGFDDDSISLASAMTYNELGLVVNDYDGGLGYGDSVGTIDMNSEGVAMLEDNLFTTRAFAEANPNTTAAFVAASVKGWAYAVANPEEAADIVFKHGSSVSPEHQAYMAKEVKKLVETDTKGNAVSATGNIDDAAMQQTLDLAKTYIKLDDSAAAS
ncbi:MAG: ABC transporter substrate-binding protein, partial [Lachnospiraceae bacterium]|nr:ABC transporter substrate-binding protein [Lachnospiraceae bacterium]